MTKDLIVRFTPKDHTEFKTVCASLGETMNDVIRKLVRDYVDEHRAKKPSIL